ncbi:cysteine hydrolase family protein [Shouchella clausii]|uniref:cysteine hydrolase family protein n=1 Tax=Shouchella clausii TaxID=79880 RepID=UPI00079CADCB|nr:isochorismatase family cysteine hydrolase [Shouchella clausii]KKI84516.1 isochorismatase [Shouchella clausii]
MKERCALLIIDMINPFDFDDADKLLPDAKNCAKAIANLKAILRAKEWPIIYVNDNYGDWQSEFTQVYNHIVNNRLPGALIAKLLAPDTEDYSVLKPQFSGFFASPLDMLLRELNIQTLILTGVVGNMCVEFTANDAYMRDYQLLIPKDGFACFTEEEYDASLNHFTTVLKADVSSSKELQKRLNR